MISDKLILNNWPQTFNETEPKQNDLRQTDLEQLTSNFELEQKDLRQTDIGSFAIKRTNQGHWELTLDDPISDILL